MITSDKMPIEKLYKQLLSAWNERDAQKMAPLFTPNGSLVGFDGSQINTPADIASELGEIFAHHETSAFVSKIREVRFLNSETALVRAVVGMVPLGKKELNPDVNAIQSLVAVKQDDVWCVAHFQNTPAQFHGRPELQKKLTKELQALI